MMDLYRAVGIVEGFEDSEHEEEVLEAWQFLVDSDVVWSLQGAFGRQAMRLIEEGLIVSKQG
jgi:hypothetical protein